MRRGASTGTSSPAFSTRRSPTRTSPAMIRACARARVSASPRWTRSRSILSRSCPISPSVNGGAQVLPLAEQGADRLRDPLGSDAEARALLGRVPVRDEGVRQADAPDGDEDAAVLQKLQHGAAEAALQAALLHRHHPSRLRGEVADQLLVERFDEAGIDHDDANPL